MHSLWKSSPPLSISDLTAYYVFTLETFFCQPQDDRCCETRNRPHPVSVQWCVADRSLAGNVFFRKTTSMWPSAFCPKQMNDGTREHSDGHVCEAAATKLLVSNGLICWGGFLYINYNCNICTSIPAGNLCCHSCLSQSFPVTTPSKNVKKNK